MTKILIGVILALVLCDVTVLLHYNKMVSDQQLIIESLAPYPDEANILSNNLLQNTRVIGTEISDEALLIDLKGNLKK